MGRGSGSRQGTWRGRRGWRRTRRESRDLAKGLTLECAKRKLALLHQQGEILLTMQKKRLKRKAPVGSVSDMNKHSSSSDLKQPITIPASPRVPSENNEFGAFKRTRTSSPELTAENCNTMIKPNEQPEVQDRSKSKFCKYFISTGKCKRGKKCLFSHDLERRRICPFFLKKTCKKGAKCLLRHTIDRAQMPACKHFLRGVCKDEDCIYSHVKVNRDAPVCKFFLRGHCREGTDCKGLHLYQQDRTRTKATTKEEPPTVSHSNREALVSSSSDNIENVNAKLHIRPRFRSMSSGVGKQLDMVAPYIHPRFVLMGGKASLYSSDTHTSKIKPSSFAGGSKT